MVCVKEGCPEKKESCGPFCTSIEEKYCTELSNGVMTDIIALTTAISVTLATGGFGAASPMTWIGLVSGVLGLLEKLVQTPCHNIAPETASQEDKNYWNWISSQGISPGGSV